MTFELIESPAPALPFPSAVIQRTQDHRYYYGGVAYPGVTGILDVLDKSQQLMWWASNGTADAALALWSDKTAFQTLLDTVGPEGVKKALTNRSGWQRDEAAKLGTEVHNIADLIVSGKDTPEMSPAALERVMRYKDWWQASGWRIRLSEALVVHPTARYGGTFDLLAYDPDGRTVLADIKTGGKWGRKAYDSEVLQLAAYGMAELVAPMGSEKAYPMPAIDRYVVLHVMPDGVKEIEITVGAAERQAFLACIDLSEWRKQFKGRSL